MLYNIGSYEDKSVIFLSNEEGSLTADGIKYVEPYFICSIFLFESAWKNKDLAALVRKLTKEGAVFFSFFGDRSEEACIEADVAILSELTSGREFYNVSLSNVIPTWCNKGSNIEESVYNVFVQASPSADYVGRVSSYLFLSLGARIQNEQALGAIFGCEKMTGSPLAI